MFTFIVLASLPILYTIFSIVTWKICNKWWHRPENEEIPIFFCSLAWPVYWSGSAVFYAAYFIIVAGLKKLSEFVERGKTNG